MGPRFRGDDQIGSPFSWTCTGLEKLRLKSGRASFWSSQLCLPRSCLPTPTCVPTGAMISPPSKRTRGCVKTSGCSDASSATPCAIRKAPTCSNWSNAFGRPRSGSTGMRTSRRGMNWRSSSTACRSAKPCASSVPSAISRILPISPKITTTSGRCGHAPPPPDRRARGRWRWLCHMRTRPAFPRPICAGFSKVHRSARC